MREGKNYLIGIKSIKPPRGFQARLKYNKLVREFMFFDLSRYPLLRFPPENLLPVEL